VRKRLTYANVTATLALFFAMSGAAFATHHYLLNSTKQINPKVLKSLKGKTGAKGKEGAAGKEGPAGKEGAPGKEGAKGPGIIASGTTKSGQFCELGTEEEFCYPSSFAFTPSVNANCVVSVISQITEVSSTEVGPYFRIAIKENSTQKNDGAHGYYFNLVRNEFSDTQERTHLIPVSAGTTYTFGAFYGGINPGWEKTFGDYEVTYNCYAT
jgi:hypothetical protein